MHPRTAEAGTPRAVPALPPTLAPTTAPDARSGISHASEGGRAAEPVQLRQACRAAAGYADGDGSQDRADGVVVVTLLSVDIPNMSSNGR